MKLIVAGGREFNDYTFLESEIIGMTPKDKDITIISGGARGADKLGEQYAKGYKIPLEMFYADWNIYGKAAGYRRNVDMANAATHLLAFWDGESKGTKHMIDIATKKGLTVNVVRYV